MRVNATMLTGDYDYQLLASLCKDLASMMERLLEYKIVREEDFNWIPSSIDLHTLAVEHFQEIIWDDEDFVSVVQHAVEICTYHPVNNFVS